MNVKERNKQVKRLLREIFPCYNVSVRNGKGTAWGWCKINIEAPKPNNCTCGQNYCQACLDKMNGLRLATNNELQNSGISFYTYTDDMNYDHKELLVQVRLV